MLEHLRSRSPQQLLVGSFPPLAVSFVVASLAFKFGSFALECLAFLALWFVLDTTWHWLVGKNEPSA